jgi:hypothetical protein
MKSHWQRLYREFCEANPKAKLDRPLAAAFRLRAWESVSPNAVDDVWIIHNEAIESENSKEVRGWLLIAIIDLVLIIPPH